MDLLVAGLTTLIVGIAVALRSRVDPGLLGLSLIVMTNLGHTIADFVQYWTQLETSLGAIARIKSFEENTPSELLPTEKTEPGDAWPLQGALTFNQVSLSYR